MINKIFNKCVLLVRILLLKIRYCKNLNFDNKSYKSIIESCNNITIEDGTINLKGILYIKKGARLGVNKGGIINIGNDCFINTNSIIVSLGTINIGDNCSIGPNVCIYDHDHSFNENGKIKSEFKIGTVTIGNNVWLGAGVIILRNSKIGNNCVIGAGTVIKGDIPDNSLVTSDRTLVINKLRKKN